MMTIKKMISCLALIALINGCSSTTTITITDPDAKVYIDGEYKGKGTVTHTDMKTIGSTTNVTVRKKGCRDHTYTFSRSEEFDVGACIGGAFVLVPFLWIQKYKPLRTFEYECRKE